jgi:hypothetical protein
VAALAADDDDEPGWAAAPTAGDRERAGVPEPAEADSPEPAGIEAEAEPAGAEAPMGGSIAAALTGPEPGRPEPGRPESEDPGPAGDEPAGRESAPAKPAAKEAPAAGPAAEGAVDQNGTGGHWSPAPVLADWAKPAAGGIAPEVDPAADWERLAAGAQAAARARAAGAQAARWRAQTDTEVANEWPGPPLHTAVRSGLLAGATAPGTASGPFEDDAQTDPGLPRPRPAAESGLAEAGPAGEDLAAADLPAAAPPEGTGSGPAGSGPAGPGQPERAPSGREARRARSRRAAADLPAEPDAADEWISLLTADPAEE